MSRFYVPPPLRQGQGLQTRYAPPGSTVSRAEGHRIAFYLNGDFISVSLAYLKGSGRRFIEADFSCSFGEDMFTGQRYAFIYRLDDLKKPAPLIPVWHGVGFPLATEMGRCQTSWFLEFRMAKKGTLLQQRRKSGSNPSG
jgi:hypothetical protein